MSASLMRTIKLKIKKEKGISDELMHRIENLYAVGSLTDDEYKEILEYGDSFTE